MLGPLAQDPSRALNPIRSTKPAGKPQTPEQKKLMAACKDFESVMMGMILKQMRGDGESSDPLNKGQANKMFKDMLDDEQAKSMTNQGNGIGLAEGIYRQLAERV